MSHGMVLYTPCRKMQAAAPARQGGALPCFARPAARCRPNQTRHCRRVVRLGANTLHGASAACPKRRVRRRTGARPPRARLPRSRRRPGQEKVGFVEGASPQPSAAGRRSPPFCPARRPMQAEPDAALPPRSAPRSEHFARFEGKVSETPRAAADRDAATPRKTSPLLSAARAKERAALRKTLRPAQPHRTRHPGHFSGQRKVSVLMRTTWGKPVFPSAQCGRAVFPSSPLPRAKKRPRSNPDRGRSACCFFQTAKVYCQTL